MMASIARFARAEVLTDDGWSAHGVRDMTERHASPDTPAWRAVWAAYGDPDASTVATWRLIVAASAHLYREGLLDRAVTHHLDRLLATPFDGRDPRSESVVSALLDLKSTIIGELVEAQATSFWQAFAETALHRTVLTGALARGTAGRAHTFLIETTGACAEYLVGRDQTRLLTPGATIADMIRRRSAIVEAARASTDKFTFGAAPAGQWQTAIEHVWKVT